MENLTTEQLVAYKLERQKNLVAAKIEEQEIADALRNVDKKIFKQESNQEKVVRLIVPAMLADCAIGDEAIRDCMNKAEETREKDYMKFALSGIGKVLTGYGKIADIWVR
jgi:hypothetical protein